MRVTSKILSIALIVIVSFGSIPLTTAFANDASSSDSTVPDIGVLQDQVQEASAAYDDAKLRMLEIEAEIEETDARIREIQAELPGARRLSNEAVREYYVMLSGTSTYLEILLGATSMEDFFAKVEYTDRMNKSFIDNMTRLTRLQEELEGARASLEQKRIEMQQEELLAEEALVEAQEARDAAQEAARLMAEASAASAAAAAAAEGDGHTPESPVVPYPGGVVNPGQPDAPADKQEFVNLWAPRLDAYLAGSPLAGCGIYFANAAFDYHVDPRYSPAIAKLESSLGNYCFQPYNAWGWGNVAWSDWETAIYAHVRGLSIGYSYTVSEADAKKYCPPNWAYWYGFVSNEMAKM